VIEYAALKFNVVSDPMSETAKKVIVGMSGGVDSSVLAAMLAARIAETCFFIGCSPFLPFGLCGASSFCVPRDVSILENFFHFVLR
jgi:PP-loop superfamily ATP-utilizing enzyme